MDDPSPSVPRDCSSCTASRWHVPVAAGLALSGLAVSLVMGFASDGVYHDDDICHYLFAVDAWTSVRAMLHQWARPGYNLPAAVVAHFFGMAGCRVFSAIQTAGVAYLAFLIGRRAAGGGWSPFAAGLVWLQPLVMTLSFTTLTETPAALYMALGLWLYMRGNRVLACAAFSVLFVTRYETMALAPILAVAVVRDILEAASWRIGAAVKSRTLWLCAAATAWAPLLYAAAAWWADLAAADSPLRLFSRTYTTEYGSGAAYHFLSVWPEAAGLGILACAVGGALWLGRRLWLATSLTVALVGVHSLLFWRGSFATGGYARFLVPLAAPVAVLAAGGLRAVWLGRNRLAVAAAAMSVAMLGALVVVCWPFLLPQQWRECRQIIAVAVAAPPAAMAMLAMTAGRRALRRLGWLVGAGCLALAVVQVAGQVRPLTIMQTPDQVHVAVYQAVRAIEDSEYADRPALTQHVLIRFLRKSRTTAVFSNQDALDKWISAEPGTLFFWESKYCYKPNEMESTRQLYASLWRLGRIVHNGGNASAVVQVFERLAGEGGNAAPHPLPLPPRGRLRYRVRP